MKILDNTLAPVETNGLSDMGSFTIKQSPKAFQILSSGLYSDKALAVIRELSCNAYDAHVMTNRRDIPIEVKLPNKLDTNFYVKDFGPGLSHDQVMHLYTTYFDSTKTGSNDFIGGLGLGSKSPFSYTDSFTVTSRQNGVINTYGAFVNDDGIPAIAQMFSDKTDEPDGLTVGFQVKPDDYYDFEKTAKTFLRWFDTKPVVKGTELAGIPTPLVSCDGLNVYRFYPESDDNVRYGDFGTWLRMGQVNYPVDWDAAGLSEHPIVTMLGSRAYLLNVPIGTVNVAASREGLQYDKQGKKELLAVLNVLAGKIITYINREIDKTSQSMAGFERNVYLTNLLSVWGFDLSNPAILETLEKGSDVKLALKKEILRTPFHPGPYKNFQVRLYKNGFTNDKQYLTVLTTGDKQFINHNSTTLILENDSRSLLGSLQYLTKAEPTEPYYIKSTFKNDFYKNAVVIVPNDSKLIGTPEYETEKKEFLEAIGNPHLRKTSEYISPKTSVAKSKNAFGVKRAQETILGYPSYIAGHLESSCEYTDTADLVWYPINLETRKVYLHGKSGLVDIFTEVLENLRKVCSNLDIETPTFVAVSKIYQKRAEAFKNARTFESYIETLFEDPKVKAALEKTLYVFNEPKQLYHHYQPKDELESIEDVLSQLATEPDALSKQLQILSQRTEIAKRDEALARCVTLIHRWLGKGPNATIKTVDSRNTFENFTKNYPLFSVLAENLNSYDLSAQGELSEDVRNYIKNKGATDFEIVWKETSY